MWAQDGAHHQAWSAERIVVADRAEPEVTLTLSEHSDYAHVDGTAFYYAEAGGSFTVTAVLNDTLAGLAQVAFPDTTSLGIGYAFDGDASATRSHTYTFTEEVNEEGVYQVAATDRATNVGTFPFTVTRDTAPPTFTLSPAVADGALRVTWSTSDAASGVDASTCELRVREDEGAWQPFSTTCAGDEVHSAAQPGHVYTFRLSATDNVSNPASTEAVARFPRVTKYYYHGGQRVAMRADGVVYYLHGDHLGSTSLTTDASRAVVARQLYHPYGTVRHSDGTLPTDFGFTGQREDGSTGLVFMHARYYDARLGRFVQADTVVPEPGNPQSLNRFSYVLGNPIRYSDPSGHTKWEPPTPLPPLPYDVTAFELGWLWLTEQCPEHIVLDENYELTQSLMHDEGVNQARAQFYQKLQEGTLENGTDDTYGYRYLVIPYIREAVQYATGDDRIGFYMGSYSVHTHLNTEEGSVTFTVEDPKTWESGTRSPFYYVPDFVGPTLNPILPESLQLRRSKHSIEDLIMDPGQFNFPSDIFIASLLSSRSRSDPGLFGSDIHLGGSIRQEFTWTEPLQVDQGE